MMKRLVLSSLAALPLLLFAQQEYTVKGSISGIKEPAKIYMQYMDQGVRSLDSVSVVQGKFKFHGSVKEPAYAYLILADGGRSLPELEHPDVTAIFLSKGVINIEGKDLKNANITGTDLNKEFAKYKLQMKEIELQMQKIESDYAAIPEDDEEFESKMGALQERVNGIEELKEDINKQYIIDNPKSYISMTLIEELLDGDNVKEYQGYFEALPVAHKNSEKGKSIKSKIETLLRFAVGEVAPDFSLPDTTGRPLALSSLRGKYVLVDFWASWCGPCRYENPHVLMAFNKYKDKGFTVLGVSLDKLEGRAAWLKAIEDDGLGQWPQVSDLKGWQSQAAVLYGITSIPQNYLLDKDGKIIASNLRGEALAEKLAELFD